MLDLSPREESGQRTLMTIDGKLEDWANAELKNSELAARAVDRAETGFIMIVYEQ